MASITRAETRQSAPTAVITFHPAPPPRPTPDRRPGRLRFLLMLCSVLLLLPNLSNTSNPGQGDEVMHIATVHDSLMSGTYLYPELNGFINFYKPPVLFWAAMALERATEWLPVDTNLLGERLISALASAGAALLLFQILLLYRRPPAQAFLWALLYLSSLGVMKFARLLMFEQMVAFHVMATMYLFAIWLRSRKDLTLFSVGLMVGASYLYKGPLIPIYLVLGLASWAFMEIYRTSDRFRFNINTGALLPVSRTALIVMSGAILPVAAYLLYVLNHPRGQELITYFVVFENAAKFVDKNQSEAVLFSGILLYLLPWTALIAGGLRRSGRALRTPASQFALLSLITFGAILLFHMIPHRKADYYMLPLFGLLFVAAGLNSTPRSLRSTQILVLILSLIGSGATIYLGRPLLSIPLILPFALAALEIYRNTTFNIRGVLPGVLLSLLLPWTVFPAIFPGILSHEDRSLLRGQDICVLSENPWTALSYRAEIKYANMIQRHPDLSSECRGSNYIIEHDSSRIPDEFQPISSYPVWKDMPVKQYLEHWDEPQKLQRSRTIYEKRP